MKHLLLLSAAGVVALGMSAARAQSVVGALGGTGIPAATTAGAAAGATAAQKGSNLSDLASPSTARVNLGAAAAGVNPDITSLTGLTVAIPISVGGTGATTAPAALTALGAASLASPSFTGNPTAPTQPASDSSTKLATTNYVATAIAAIPTPSSGSGGTATTVGSGTDLTPGNITPTGGVSTSAGAIAADAVKSLQPAAIGTTVASQTDSRFNYNTGNYTIGLGLLLGTTNSAGNHQDYTETLSAYGTGSISLTPIGVGEGASNNIGVVTSGGAKLSMDVMCQNGTDTASWHVAATYLAVSGAITKTGATITSDVVATSGASAWTITMGTDTTNNAMTAVVGAGSATPTCSARADVLTVK